MRIRTGTALAPLFFLTSLVFAQEVQIGVMGLFRPRQLSVSATSHSAVVVQGGDARFILEPSSGNPTAHIRISEGQMFLDAGRGAVPVSEARATGRNGGPVDFVMTIPGKIHRHYRGTLSVRMNSGVLVPVVTMDLETAVASVVRAESPPNAPLEALKAQAVATRSYFVAGKGRHHDFDFCDTTHCQFLREPPGTADPASIAASATRGLVLSYREQPFAAMFTRSCGGRTRTPQEVGLSGSGYPYFAVSCKYCQRHPFHWSSHITASEAAALSKTGETARLEIDRRLGWQAVPSNNYTAHVTNQGVALEGTGQGHGIGLCQAGAKAMAEAGAGFREILDHYYANTSLVEVGDKRATLAD